jgi:hypothetical protein
VEECTYFWGVNTSWGINTAESKRPINQEDNQAPQPIVYSMKTYAYDQGIINIILRERSMPLYYIK